MHLGNEIPVSWLLHCIASLATTLLIIHPPDNPELDDIPVSDLIIYLAQRLGAFNLPIFVSFFPNGYQDMLPAEYTTLFRIARNTFHNHAPMIAFVWNAPSHTATPNNPFYPGHNVVDWVALPLMSAWNEQTGYRDILRQFEQFYASFHEHKPIMVLPLGISHFTRGDYTYRLSEAAEEIERIYRELGNFPRLGLIVYADAFTLAKTYTDDFSISIETELSKAYKNAISGENFLNILERTTEETARWVRAQTHGYFYNGSIFISHSTLENELFISPPRQVTQINENPFAESQMISDKNIFACEQRRVIFVGNKP
jgi:hypothetical protein